MDLSTNYLGLELDSPLILGASPLARDLDAMQRAEADGASAIVMRSLFEEQVNVADGGGFYPVDRHEVAFGPDEYLEQIRRLKAHLHIPVIGSLNGSTNENWLKYASLIDHAGADALELNVYRVPTEFDRTAASIEDETVELVRSVVSRTTIPVAVKLSPFYTSLPNLVERLVHAGARGLVLFNRFYQPDIDTNRLEVSPRIAYSDSSELLLRLRWLAILSPRIEASFAVTGGVHTSEDALKAILTGADGVQLVSEILEHGFIRFAKIRRELAGWLSERGYGSIGQVRDRMNLESSLNPGAYERANYLHVLHSWPPPATLASSKA